MEPGLCRLLAALASNSPGPNASAPPIWRAMDRAHAKRNDGWNSFTITNKR